MAMLVSDWPILDVIKEWRKDIRKREEEYFVTIMNEISETDQLEG